MTIKKLPTGIQDFPTIREIESDFIYVDKTKEIIDMIDLGRSSFFSRPRRFGKSLTLSTMEALFDGKKELFKGLYAENNWDWTKTHPVIKIDCSGMMYDTLLEYIRRFRFNFYKICDKYQVDYSSVYDDDICIFLEKLILSLNKKYNSKVVILVDEYDFPLVHSLDDLELCKKIRKTLGTLYSTLKQISGYLQYVLISGVSKFTKLSLFSMANHLKDLTMHKKISTLCGYTHKEVLENFKEFLDGIDLEEMKLWYNGYNYLGEPLYNPYDVLFLFDFRKFENYWWETGTPTLLINQLKKENFSIPDFESKLYDKTILDSFDIENINPIALFWQSGYLTFDKEVKEDGFIKYKMKYPNFEVKRSLNGLFLKTLTEDEGITNKSKEIKEALESHDANIIKTKLNSLFASLSNNSYTKNNIGSYEGYYINILYTFFYFLHGYKTYTEVATNIGRIDLSLEGEKEVFVIEIKVNKEASLAIKQIKEKKYYEKYLASKKNIYLLGITFSEDSKSIYQIKIEKV